MRHLAELRILLVEDNPDDAEMIRTALESAGLDFSLHTVELRRELEDALAAENWSLVLCDSRLPGYTGTDAFGWIRERLPEVPVVFCSGSGDPGDPAIAGAIGQGVGLVDKNRLAGLAETVRRALAPDDGD